MTDAPEPIAALLRPPPALLDAGLQWAKRLHLPLVESNGTAPYSLLVQLLPDHNGSDYRLAVQINTPNPPGPVSVDFAGGALGHRRRFGGGRGQPLARAVGLKHGATPQVVDVTAGLGRDAFVLAHLGCSVRMVERVPLVAALLEDALARAAADPDLAAVIGRMQLFGADSIRWLADLNTDAYPDVIYLDPMYPQRRKQALVKKEMQLFHILVGADQDAPALLARALTRVRKRVVVKRPRGAPPLEGPPPTFAIHGPNTRYDVYVVG